MQLPPPSPARAALAAVCVTMLTACASRVPAPDDPQRGGAVETPNAKARLSDERIRADHAAYAQQQAAIKAVNDTGQVALRTYGIAKAQCWLDVSFHEYTRNDRSAFPDEALAQSRLITDHLSAQDHRSPNPALDTPLVNGADRLRPDLWAHAEALKRDPGFVCAQRLVACGEVELVHAGNEHRQQGWRHAKPYVQIAEDQLRDAQQLADACPRPAVLAPPPPPPVVALPPPAPVPPPVVVRDKLVIGAQALFRYNRSGRADLLDEGRRQLDELARRIGAAYSRVDVIELTGYTDRLGSDAYNERLSRDRAETVKLELQARGITVRINTRGKGKADPVVQCAGDRPTPALTACLQPNRRVEVEVVGLRSGG